MTRTRKIVIAALTAALLGAGTIAVQAAMPEGMGHEEREFLPLHEIHDRLHLTAEQEETWQKLADRTRGTRMSDREQHKELKSRLERELDRAQPDLASIAALSDKNMDEETAKRRQLRNEWLKFYDQLSPDQKLVVRDAIKAKLAKLEMFRERIRHPRESRNPS